MRRILPPTGAATSERQVAVDRTVVPTRALTHDLGGPFGHMVRVVSVVGTEPG